MLSQCHDYLSQGGDTAFADVVARLGVDATEFCARELSRLRDPASISLSFLEASTVATPLSSLHWSRMVGLTGPAPSASEGTIGIRIDSDHVAFFGGCVHSAAADLCSSDMYMLSLTELAWTVMNVQGRVPKIGKGAAFGVMESTSSKRIVVFGGYADGRESNSLYQLNLGESYVA
jgi:hypothetical protein